MSSSEFINFLWPDPIRPDPSRTLLEDNFVQYWIKMEEWIFQLSKLFKGICLQPFSGYGDSIDILQTISNSKRRTFRWKKKKRTTTKSNQGTDDRLTVQSNILLIHSCICYLTKIIFLVNKNYLFTWYFIIFYLENRTFLLRIYNKYLAKFCFLLRFLFNKLLRKNTIFYLVFI